MEDLTHSMAMAAPPACPTDSFSKNWLLNTYPPFEFSYTRSESEEAAEWDDQGSFGVESFTFSTQLPHWFQVSSEEAGVLYADELFFDGLIKSPALLQQSSSCTERESLFIVKRGESSVSSSPAAVRRCSRFLGKWGKDAKRVVIKCWKAFKCTPKSKKNKKTMCGSQSGWPSRRSAPDSFENPIYEAVLHCKRSSIGA